MAQEKEYFAFISYQRKDEEWAERLRKKLEHYRLPSNIRKQNTSLPKEIRPIFRDALELTGGFLAKEIETALQQSKYLIVICSPNSAKSPWVNKEIQTFIDLGREDRIIPFIIDGTPFSDNEETECFPPALRSLKGEKELLGININELNRDAASIKVVAHMFGLKFDSLWQRYEREKNRKRWMWIVASILLAISGLGIGVFFNNQNNIIKSQYEQLNSYVSYLKEANNTYSQLQGDLKQYTLAGELRGNSCDDLWIMHFDYHPFEPIVAFSDDWGFWLHYLNSNIEVPLPVHEEFGFGEVTSLCFSEDGTELMADGYFGVYIWNVDRCELLSHHFYSDDKYINSQEFKKKFSCANEQTTKDYQKSRLRSRITGILKEGTLAIYEKSNGSVICSTHFEMNKDSTFRILPNPRYDEILYISPLKAALYDDTKKGFDLFFKGYNDTDAFEFDKSGEYLRIDKTIYARTIRIDTIQNLEYTKYPLRNYPVYSESKNYQYDETTKASLDFSDFSIIYKRGNFIKEIEVVKNYTIGNGQEYVSNSIFAGPNKVIAIVEQGKHRIYNTKTWDLIGTLENPIWNGTGGKLGNEIELSHGESYIADAKYINKKLYILSSGGILRIYNIDKVRLETVIELPFERNKTPKCLDKFILKDDASQIIYSFRDDSIYYICKLPLF